MEEMLSSDEALDRITLVLERLKGKPIEDIRVVSDSGKQFAPTSGKFLQMAPVTMNITITLATSPDKPKP